MTLAPNTPVIVGVGFEEQRSDDPLQCSEPYELMVAAVRAAASDAGSDALVRDADSLSIPQGLWHYKNPCTLVANALGCRSPKTIVSDLGILQLTLLSDVCRAIAAGERHIGIITAGEAKFRELRSTITQTPAPVTEQGDDTPAPDVRMTTSDPFCSDLESKRGFSAAADCFAVVESALRYERGVGIEEHRDEIARLYSGFSEVAARNPHGWRREPIPAEVIRNPSAKNAMQAFPYTKLHCSQWNVNQGVAIIVCSAAKAAELGLHESGWIYPLSTAESKHVVVLAQQRRLHSHPGTIMTAERALELARVTRAGVEAAELYSCFPAAIQSFARDVALDPRTPLTVTGCMAFGGGPFNHASLAGVARMVEVLRADAPGAPSRRVGLVTNLSGIFGKQGCAVFSNTPNRDGYRYEDVTAAVAKIDEPVPLDESYAGPAKIAGYTVMYVAGAISHGLAICDTPNGARTVARSDDKAALERMTKEEFCGRTVQVGRDGSFSLT